MYVPSPNEQDYLVWAGERIDAGDVELEDDYGGEYYIDVAPWTRQCVLDGVRRFGDDSELQYEDIVVQFHARAGVEPRPWAWEEESFGQLEGYQDADLGDDDDYDYDDVDEGEPVPPARVILPVREHYSPATAAEGAAFLDGRAYVVWGDWLWEACAGGRLRGIVELPARSELYCTSDSLLVLSAYDDFVLVDPVTCTFVERDVDIPVFRNEAWGEARTLRESDWIELPICVDARIFDVSNDGRFIRIKDGLGKGGILEVGTWNRVGDAGGPYRESRPAREGPKLGGEPMTSSDWRELLRRIRTQKLSVRRASGFAWHEGRCRYTDNGLTFFEDDQLILVLDRPTHRVSFSADGRYVLASTDDALLHIDLDAKAIVDEWRQPARLRYLRSVLPAYQPDEYIEQVVALWEVLADPNERDVSSMKPAIDDEGPRVSCP